MTKHVFFDTLFEHARHVTPYLDGQLSPRTPAVTPLIQLGSPSSETIQSLYRELQLAHPEAGAAYWLTRTWTLLCWQPIYVAFVSIYACHGLPKLSSMAQSVQPRFISGFHFDSLTYTQDSQQVLITQAGSELIALFDYFREQIAQWTRIRPGFTQHLFADAILGCVVKLHHFYPHLGGEFLLQHAKRWLRACHLPEKHLHSLRYDSDTHRLTLVRTSCCLVYKCEGRKLCQNCPRHPDNKR
ncbi:siderophore ferric iron reductase [Vibrio sp. JPW-9-11-11]|uniref:siderophore ferric iron reductase n=1 Tax=Vibrio sp. JPW-9-11-11 TaxID=1416532 RepID=UPI001593BB4D|nr:siderophore ferric iron reductase [Vibrio sp. JPW-9-11-11]NVD08557.1 siderophore ferric iron reductase [Vibrio sp. JPW-9-11-11]